MPYELMRFDHRWWVSEPSIRLLDPWDRGVLFDMAALSWDSQNRGELIVAGSPMRLRTLAQALGLPLSEEAGKKDNRRSLEETIPRLLEYGLLDRRGISGALRVVKIAQQAETARRRGRLPQKARDNGYIDELERAQEPLDNPSTSVRRSRANADWLRAQLADTDEQELPTLDKHINRMTSEQGRSGATKRRPTTILTNQLDNIDDDYIIQMEEAYGEDLDKIKVDELLTEFRRKAKAQSWMYRDWQRALLSWLRAKKLGRATRDEVRARQQGENSDSEVQEVSMVAERAETPQTMPDVSPDSGSTGQGSADS